MSDLISRQVAIEAMEQRYCDIERVKKRPVTKGEQAIFLDMRGVVRSLPSGEPERKTGKWEHMVGFWECDQCHAEYTDMPTCMGKVIYEYCPMCGAKMEEEDG